MIACENLQFLCILLCNIGILPTQFVIIKRKEKYD